VVTDTELGYLDGVTSAIQTQFDGKVPEARTISAGTGLTGGGDLSANRTLSVDTGGIDTDQLASGAVTAAKLDSQAVGVDPVFGTDDTTGTTIASVTTAEVIPAGVWWGYRDSALVWQVSVNSSWRDTGGQTELLISDGTNVRCYRGNTSDDTFYLRRVYP
jgi:hypothetical protein